METAIGLLSVINVAGTTVTVSNNNIARKVDIKQQEGEIRKHRFRRRFFVIFSLAIVYR